MDGIVLQILEVAATLEQQWLVPTAKGMPFLLKLPTTHRVFGLRARVRVDYHTNDAVGETMEYYYESVW